VLITTAIWNILNTNHEYAAAQDEYEMLRNQFEHIILQTDINNDSTATPADAAQLGLDIAQSNLSEPQIQPPLRSRPAGIAALASLLTPRLQLSPGGAAAGLFPLALISPPITILPGNTTSSQPPAQTPLDNSRSMFKHLPKKPADDAQHGLKDINPDYIGWIIIPGTGISYPVVLGPDNEKYINLTFSGHTNSSGAIFMDYRCTKGFDSPVSLVYGHSMNDGSMFAPIRKYLDVKYINEHPIITISTVNGDILTYRIFNARRVEARDSVYSMDFLKVPEAGVFPGAPDSADRFLILSTCIGYKANDERLVVYAALEK